jgi:hydrogenase maturation protease
MSWDVRTLGCWDVPPPEASSTSQHPNISTSQPRIAVYGIGNILLGDDGVGPAVALFLNANFDFPPNVVVEDLGTPSLDLPGYLLDFDAAIFVDAVAADAPPGTIRTFTRDEIMAVAPGIRISPHEPSINDALIVLDFAGKGPRDVVLVGIVPQTLEGGVTLSTPVATAVPGAAEAVVAELARRGIRAQRRRAA